MAEGTVKWFNTRKGYGFISTEDGSDIFVHYSNIESDGYKTLGEGDPVTFDVVKGEKGLRAENVVPKAAKKSKSAPKKKEPKAEEPETEETPEAEEPEEQEPEAEEEPETE